MINAAPYIRKALVAALSGLSYEGAAVPVYDNEGNAEIRQIIIAETTMRDTSSKDSFRSTYTQLVEVVCFQQTALRKHVDAIGQLISTVLRPTPKTIGMSLTDSLQLVWLALTDQNYLDEEDGDGTKIVRLLLRLELRIAQTN